MREKFADITHRGFNQFINERINERLKSAMTGAGPLPSVTEAPPLDTSPVELAEAAGKDNALVTSDEEREGFFIVRAILRETVDPARVILRDQQSYCGILLDNNNRKPICRLHFNRVQKYVGVFGQDKDEERLPIMSLNDMYKHADRLKAIVVVYDNGSGKKVEDESAAA